jgi:AGZA family xanthine/uracil permease-like MFS transporter
VTTFVESASGVAAGGRTGLTAVFAALLFLASIFIAPIAAIIPAAAHAAIAIRLAVFILRLSLSIH